MQKKERKTILIVEDDASLSRLIVLELQEAGYEAILMRTAEDALEFLQTRKPDLIWLDLYLPIMDGFQFLEHIRKDPATKDLKVVLVSVSWSESKVKEAKKYNVLDYFVKSNYRLEELVKLVGSDIDKK